MTNEEAIKVLENGGWWDLLIPITTIEGRNEENNLHKAIDLAISALHRIDWEDTIWHDAETDPPITPGLYYGKKDDTNGMYAVNYLDGVWTLDAYPDHKMQIIQWANYGAFRSEENE